MCNMCAEKKVFQTSWSHNILIFGTDIQYVQLSNFGANRSFVKFPTNKKVRLVAISVMPLCSQFNGTNAGENAVGISEWNLSYNLVDQALNKYSDPRSVASFTGSPVINTSTNSFTPLGYRVMIDNHTNNRILTDLCLDCFGLEIMNAKVDFRNVNVASINITFLVSCSYIELN